MNPISPIIFHIPHASQRIPVDVRQSILLSQADLENELIRMTDAFTDELFAADIPGVQTVIHQVSRLVLDPERFLDDDQEIMAKQGMGVIYTRTSNGQMLRHSPTLEERVALINRYYRPHHQKLEDCVSTGLQCFGRSMIIDCHSFPSTPLPYEDDQNPDRPDICIGTDPFHTPEWLKEKVVLDFKRLEFSVKINRPFAGSIVPMKHYQKESRVLSIMIELNRKLYMDESSGKKNNRFDNLRGKLSEILKRLQLLVSS